MANKKQSLTPSGKFASKCYKKETTLPDKTVTPEKEKEASRQSAADSSTPDVKGPIKASKPTTGERQPAFEQLMADLPTGQEAPEEKVERRGGLRSPPGGRPRGTDDLSRVNKLPEKANEQICPVLKIPFTFWAKTQKLPDLALSDAEAKEWALPITKLLEFYFPGRIPEIAWVWLMMLGSSFNIMDKRMEIIDKARKEKAETTTSPKGGAGPTPVKTGPRPNQIVTVADIDKSAYNVKL